MAKKPKPKKPTGKKKDPLTQEEQSKLFIKAGEEILRDGGDPNAFDRAVGRLLTPISGAQKPRSK